MDTAMSLSPGLAPDRISRSRPMIWKMRLEARRSIPIAQQTGMSRSDLLAGLSNHLPELIDQLTPNGRLPSQEEAARMA